MRSVWPRLRSSPTLVEGLALLIIDGPLRGMTRAQTQVVGQRLQDMVEKGLA
ncbi:MAG: hypothetical protein ACREYA_29240 [Cupriavidus necator]